jgi:branched-chain amino acid transport system ATP-binding protein
MVVLELKNITKKFKGLIAVNNVSFQINEGEIVGLIGPNGAGKTTLFDMISCNVPPDGSSPYPNEGKIYFYGKDITNLPAYKRCHLGIGRTFQLTKPILEMKVIDNVIIGILFGKESKNYNSNFYEEAKKICEFVSLSDKTEIIAKNLTTPDKKKLELARALATKPKLLLLDEVMAGLTPTEIVDACEIIKKIRNNGITLLVVEHVMKAIMSISDRIIVMDHGIKIAEGKPGEIVNNLKVIEAYLGEEKNYGENIRN